MCLYRYNIRTQHTQTTYVLTICAIHGTIRIQYDIQYICVAHMCKSHMRQYNMCVIDACYNILIQSMFVAFYECMLFVQYKYAPCLVHTCVLHRIHMAIDTCISVHSTHVAKLSRIQDLVLGAFFEKNRKIDLSTPIDRKHSLPVDWCIQN